MLKRIKKVLVSFPTNYKLLWWHKTNGYILIFWHSSWKQRLNFFGFHSFWTGISWMLITWVKIIRRSLLLLSLMRFESPFSSLEITWLLISESKIFSLNLWGTEIIFVYIFINTDKIVVYCILCLWITLLILLYHFRCSIIGNNLLLVNNQQTC